MSVHLLESTQSAIYEVSQVSEAICKLIYNYVMITLRSLDCFNFIDVTLSIG